MAAAQFCSSCGAPLTNGVCIACPPKTLNQPAPPAAYQQPGQWGSQGQAQGQWRPQGQWNASAPWAAPPPAYGVGSQFIDMWNWGAFLLCPFWLMNHGRVGRGILYLVLSIIPFVSLAAFAMAIAYGLKGNEVAATSRYFYDDAQFVAVQNAWRNWGIGVLVVSVVIVVLGGIVEGVSTTAHGY